MLEVRKSDGTQYPPLSILCGLQRYIRRNNTHPVSIFDKSDVFFRGLRGTMESMYQKLHKEGLDVQVKHASLITVEDEEKLLESKTLGDHQPEVLLRTVFYLNGRNLCLRGGPRFKVISICERRLEIYRKRFKEFS